MISDAIKAYPQYLMPGHLISRVTHKATRIEAPWFKNGMIRGFSALFDIDMTDAVLKNPEDFATFNAFFTRALKPESRPIDPSLESIVSPVDGTISQMTLIQQGEIFQAKGHQYTVSELLGGDEQRAAQFANGRFTTIYLSPRDYHRIHIPVSGTLTEMVHVPGRLFSVNPATTRTIPGLFARNERVVSHFDTPMGPMAVVMVGAVNVGSIQTIWAGEVTPPAGKNIMKWDYREANSSGDPLLFDKGAEIGLFNMGSTVILLFANPDIQWEEGLKSGDSVKMGAKIGEIR
ncbi:MAG: archaetidylserine decarboxylase [Gammaproteobacteria bacterium]|nr:archaetidylserine decarboxylase [Gammaproteobacteria bacterium]